MKVAASLALVAAAGATQSNLCDKLSTADEIMGQKEIPSLTGTVALVTGGDSGLGYSIATTLAQQGATVAIAGHNAAKTAAAATNITAAAKAVGSSGTAKGYQVDFASFSSTRSLADAINNDYQSLSYLFNNAGIAPGLMDGGANITATADGFESVTQVDVLGPLLLTEKLLPLMRKTRNARVVNTASTAHEMACAGVGQGGPNPSPDDDCLKYADFRYLTGNISNLPPFGLTYGVAKYGNILHARALAANENPDEVQAYSVCPGYALTGLVPSGEDPKLGCELIKPLHMTQDPCPYTAEQGAAVHMTSAFLATENGRWYQRYNQCSDERAVAAQGFTEEMLQPWYRTMKTLVGIQDSVIV